MKYTIFFAIFTFLSTTIGYCQQSSAKYVIEGDLSCVADALTDVDSVTLYEQYNIISRVPLNDYRFSVEGSVSGEFVLYGQLVFENSAVVLPLFLEPGNIKIRCVEQRDTSMFSISVTGTPSNNINTGASLRYSEINYQMIDISEDSTLSDDKKLEQMNLLLAEQENLFKDMVKDNFDSPIAPYLYMQKYYYGNDYKGLRNAIEKLSEGDLKNHPAVSDLKTVLKMMPGLMPGDTVSEYKGTYLLLDVWSSISGVNMDDFPKLKKLNRKSDNKLSIVGICTDPTEQMMQTTVKNYGLKWEQILDSTCNFSQKYNITSYPARFLIDPEGVVLEKNPDLKKLSKRDFSIP